MKLVYLADYPEHVPTLAKWIMDEWGAASPGTTQENLEQKFRGHLNRHAVPLTLLAMEAGRPQGMASLVFYDMKDHQEQSPWLAAVYVLPEQRGRGIGSKLVKTIELLSAHLDVEKLYLFTPDQEGFYARMNWTVLERTRHREKHVAIMVKEIL